MCCYFAGCGYTGAGCGCTGTKKQASNKEEIGIIYYQQKTKTCQKSIIDLWSKFFGHCILFNLIFAWDMDAMILGWGHTCDLNRSGIKAGCDSFLFSWLPMPGWVSLAIKRLTQITKRMCKVKKLEYVDGL